MKHVKYFFTGLGIVIFGILLIGIVIWLFWLACNNLLWVLVIGGGTYAIYGTYKVGKEWYNRN